MAENNTKLAPLIFKMERPEQFPLDEILSERDRMARAYMSAEARDTDGEIIPIADFRKTMNTYMKRGGFIIDQHSNRVIGKTLNWKETDVKTPGGEVPGIMIDYQIFDDYSIDDQAWDEIKSNKRKGLSFGGRALNDPEVKMDAKSGELTRHLTGIEAYEISSVTDPANEYAKNISVNYLAKGTHKKSQSQDTDNNKGGNIMPDTKKEDMPAPEMDEGMESGVEERIAALEARLEEILGMISAQKADHEVEEPKAEPKAEDEEEVEMSKEADSGGPGEPEIEGVADGEGEDVVLPKASAGETDEDAPIEGDEVEVVEKAVAKVMKDYGFTKTRGQRPTAEIKKGNTEGDLALDLMKQIRSGDMKPAEMNRIIKEKVSSERNDAIRDFLKEGE